MTSRSILWTIVSAFWLLVFLWLGRLLFPSNTAFDKGVNPVLLSQGDSAAARIQMLRMELMPYTGYHNPAHTDERFFFDGRPVHYRTNNFGFLSPYDLHPIAGTTSPPIGLQPNERIILLTGGSAAWGYGASDNTTSLGYVLEDQLNRLDPSHSWHVVNLAMMSWIAYQEFIALDLYGSFLHPDWVVTLDGRNDMLIPTVSGERVPNYLYFTAQKRLNDLFTRSSSLWERLFPFLRHRELSAQLDEIAKPLPQVASLLELSRATEFYVHSLESIAKLFRGAHLLFVTQPMDFHEAEAQGEFARRGYDQFIPRIKRLRRRYPNTHYLDANTLFRPPLHRYFVDDCHMTDLGQSIVGKAIARAILAKAN